jgi:hypothetical protein
MTRQEMLKAGMTLGVLAAFPALLDTRKAEASSGVSEFPTLPKEIYRLEYLLGQTVCHDESIPLWKRKRFRATATLKNERRVTAVYHPAEPDKGRTEKWFVWVGEDFSPEDEDGFQQCTFVFQQLYTPEEPFTNCPYPLKWGRHVKMVPD